MNDAQPTGKNGHQFPDQMSKVKVVRSRGLSGVGPLLENEKPEKNGCTVVHLKCNNANQFEGLKIKRSKVKVIRLTNAEIKSVSYFPKGKAYELQTWYTDGARKPVPPTSAMISKIKGQGRKVTWSV